MQLRTKVRESLNSVIEIADRLRRSFEKEQKAERSKNFAIEGSRGHRNPDGTFDHGSFFIFLGTEAPAFQIHGSLDSDSRPLDPYIQYRRLDHVDQDDRHEENWQTLDCSESEQAEVLAFCSLFYFTEYGAGDRKTGGS